MTWNTVGKSAVVFGVVLALPAVATAALHVVEVASFAFTPPHIVIQQGDTVRWVWVSGSHTTTSGEACAADGLWNSPISAANPTFEYTFDAEGLFPYYCIPHCGLDMTGSVTVEGAMDVGTDSAPGPAAGVRIMLASANPVVGEARLLLQVDTPQTVAIDVIDASGRRVAKLAEELFARGDHEVVWDGLKEDGSAAAAGVYYTRFWAPHADLRNQQHSLILLR